MSVTQGRLSYDVVMATRNRPEAVALSLPLLLRQTRPPAQIVIVDSSEDGAPIAALARDAGRGSDIPVHYHHSGPGLTHQRNVGLRHCAGDVVLFPDDDSLLYLDAAAEIMAVYEADTAGLIAGVGARPMTQAPPETPGDLGVYEAETVGPLRAALQRARQGVKEATGALNPFVAAGRRLGRDLPRPDWLAAREVAPVPYITGFRMSFRRSHLQPEHFDETLQRYGWFEDVDASFTALRGGLVVSAQRARLYHHRVADARANGYRMGLWAILNRGYVVMKHVRANPQVFADPASDIRRLRRYCRLRTAAYTVLGRDAFGRDRARGARDGLARLEALTGAAPEDLAAVYKRLEAEAQG